MKRVAIVMALLVGAFLMSVFLRNGYESLTYDVGGSTVLAGTLTGTAATVRDTAVSTNYSREVDDQSRYPHDSSRRGYITRYYRFAEHGGAVGTINIGEDIPDNLLIVGGFIDVITAITPAGSTNALSIMAAGDVLAAGTTLNSTGLKAIVPDYATIGDSVRTSNSSSNLVLTITGSAATAGEVMVYLDCWKTN